MVYDEDFEDEFEDDEFEDEFDDEFEDEFADEFEDEFSSFGPVYIQGETSIGFETYAMVASFAVVFLAVIMLVGQVLGPVYDGLAGVEPEKYDGLGIKQGGEGPDTISFAPHDVEIIGVGRYDTTPGDVREYDYAVLNAGADHGIGVGLIYTLHDQDGKPSHRMIVTSVEPQLARADFVEIASEQDPETVNITRTYTDPDNRISRDQQDTVWQRETVRELLLMLDEGWRDRGVTEEEQIDAMERFATLGVPDRTGEPVFELSDDVPTFDSGNEDAMGRAQLQVFNELRNKSPQEAADMLREYVRRRQPPWRMEQVDGIQVPAPFYLPQEAPLSPVLRNSLVSEALDLEGWDTGRRLPDQFPNLNMDWNILTWTRVGESDIVGPSDGDDVKMISLRGSADGAAVFRFGRPVAGVRAHLIEAEDQVVIKMILERLRQTIAESDVGGG